MTSEQLPIIELPVITVQHDLAAVEADVSDGTCVRESCWVSCYPASEKENAEGVHASVLIEKEGDKLEYTARDGVEVSNVTSTGMVIGCSRLAIPPTKVRRPKQTIRNLHKNGISTFDVSPTDNQALVTGGQSGTLRIGAWGGAHVSASLEAGGVLGDVTDVRFFPSGEVLLVASTDMRTRVFGIQGSNPRTFEGHTRSVETCLPLPPKGRLVLTGSKDSTVKLWRVSDAACLHTFRLTSAVNEIAIGERPPGFEGGLRPPDGDDDGMQVEEAELEKGTIALVALASGSVAVLDVSARSSICTLSTGSTSPALAIAYDTTSGLIATGHLNGNIVLQRLGHPDSSPLATFRRATRAAVHSVLFSAPSSDGGWPTLLVGGEDGLPWRAAFTDQGDEGVRVQVIEEFMGIDTDSVSALREGRGGIFAASKDGCVRRW